MSWSRSDISGLLMARLAYYSWHVQIFQINSASVHCKVVRIKNILLLIPNVAVRNNTLLKYLFRWVFYNMLWLVISLVWWTDILFDALHTVHGNENKLSFAVRCRWSVQGWAEQFSDERAGRRWLQWCRSPCHTNTYWNHYPGHQNTECPWWKRQENQRTDLSCTKKVQLPRGNCWGNHFLQFAAMTLIRF